MSDRRIRRALISVYDKTGIVEFARALRVEFGIEIISTGGTARLLRENGIPVTLVEDITGFPEMLDGRVKTLHPKIHAAILADRDNPEHMRQLAERGIEPIDMVVVNLYPFEETIRKPGVTREEAIEMIDIGGPCLLRAAAKNHKHVLVVSRPGSYDVCVRSLREWREDTDRVGALQTGAIDAYFETASYDSRIAEWLTVDERSPHPLYRFLRFFNWGPLRYGENPHQTAELLSCHEDPERDRLQCAETHMDNTDHPTQPRMSTNNYVDADAALQLCAELARSVLTGRHALKAGATSPSGRPACCVFIKHTNACGASVHNDPIEAYRLAYLGDPNAAMGGILAVNFNVTGAFADVVMNSLSRWGKDAGAGAFFVEVWVAPDFDDDAIDMIESSKTWGKRVRMLRVGEMHEPRASAMFDIKQIAGGAVFQTRDVVGLNEEQWRVVTKRAPTDAEMADLRLAWLIAKHTKSNAISLCKDGMLIGNGAGQMSRVMSCRIATWLANENGHAEKLAGSAAASDAFFPFRDGPDLLLDAGVTAIIQPGGSKRDDESIAACDEHGAAMIFTGTRHFKH